jgi:signal transduction histidine kinase
VPPGAAEIRADERTAIQILRHLVSNAVKFTPEGGRVTVSVGARPGGGWEIAVADTGIGMDPSDVERIFQPFVQLDSRLSRQHGGTGLGLTLVRRLAELHGGRVTVETRPGAGSRFVVICP